MSETPPQYTYRDRVKFACFNYALEQGLNEEEMVEYFTEAADAVRTMKKANTVANTVANTAGGTALDWLKKEIGTFQDWNKSTPGYIAAGIGAVLLAPSISALGGHLGYGAGQSARLTREGYIPKPEEIHVAEETAEYQAAFEEIRRRVILNRWKQQQNKSVSNRRMF